MAFRCGCLFPFSTTTPSPLLPSKTLKLKLVSPRPIFLALSPKRPVHFNVSALQQTAEAASVAPLEDKGVVRSRWKAAIDFKWIRENKDLVAENIKKRNSSADLDLVLELYEKMCGVQKEVERLREERNIVAGRMKGKMELSERQILIEKGKNLKEELAGLEEGLVQITEKLQFEAQCIPNLTHPDVPVGGEEASVMRNMVSGSKFYYLKNEAVLLEMGLVNWALVEAKKKGFTPLITPEIVRSPVVEKCGFQPRGRNTQVYSIEGTDQCLIGTAEIPVGGIHMDSIIPDSALPLKYVAYSHCFRTEAGAAGMATRGLYRVHQFSKVEMFIICRPEDSNTHLEELIDIEEKLFKSLGLHSKTLDMGSGDLGAPAYRKYDVEAWMPGLGRYGEISSASNCTDYQSRRLGIRFRPSSSELPSVGSKKSKGSNIGSTQFVHTLNATACAVPRMIICLLENFQEEDGSIVIPEPLRPYMGGLDVIGPKSK